ncbi:MAG TPA: sugar kinase, partial [Verrucomicrobiales bacterium]|nr:sugar kinase [Verrucomicrobiales bacterium]
MSLLVFGSTALDSISTPKKKNPRLLGGSGSHAAVAASFFVSPKLIGVVGTDFPRKYMTLFKKHKVNLKGVKVREGRTFHWAGEYEVNMNNRRTLSTELGVVEGY